MINSSTFSVPNFNANQFISEVYQNAPKIDIRSLESLNFNPLIDFFSSLSSNLENLKTKLSEDLETCLLVSEINAETRKAEQDIVLSEYSALSNIALELESQLSNGAGDSLHLENDLLFLEKEKRIDTITGDLLSQFLLFNKKESSEDQDKLNQMYNEVEDFDKIAINLYILNKVASSISNNEFSLAIETISQKFEIFKKKLISAFKEEFWKFNVKNVQHLVKLTEKFEVFKEISTYFIETSLHDLKIDKTREINFEESKKLFIDLCFSINRAYSKLFAGYEPKFGEIGEREYQVNELFGEKSNDLTKQIISYTFENYISYFIEKFLDKTKHSRENHLKFLEFFYSNILNLNKEILKIDSPISGTLTDLFSAYCKSLFDEILETYFVEEIFFFKETINKKINEIVDIIKNKENYKNIESSFNLKIDSANKTEKKKKEVKWHAFIAEAVFQHNVETKPQKKISKNEKFRRVNVLKEIILQESTEEIFKLTNLCVNRCFLLSPDIQKSQNIFNLLDVFLQVFGNGLVIGLVKYTEEIIPSLNSSKALDPGFFEIVSKINVLVQRMDLIYMNSIRTLSMNEEINTNIAKKEKIIQSLEILLHKTIQNALASVFVYSNRILAEKQKKKDYLIKEEVFDKKCTDTCKDFISILRNYVEIVKQFASNNNKTSILNSLGSQIIAMLIEHFTHYKISQKGAVILQLDIQNYFSFLTEFEDENLEKDFELLRNLGKLFLINNEKLADYIKENKLDKKCNSETLEKYIKNRSD